MKHDLLWLRAQMEDGALSASLALERALEAAQAPAAAHVFTLMTAELARAQARASDDLAGAGTPRPSLGGIPISIKDLFDVAGQPTRSASRVLEDATPAAEDSTAVARLRAAGAVFVGRTNMSEFAFSAIGTNPHFGTPVNAAALAIDATPRVPGGSTSGGAVSLSIGAAWAALGSDTGGSIRIPAAFNGQVGFKSSFGVVPTQGTLPLSTSLDSVGAITLSVRDAVLLHTVLTARAVDRVSRPPESLRLALPRQIMRRGADAAVQAAFEHAVVRISRGGAGVEEIDVPEFDELAAIQHLAGFSAIECWAAQHAWVERAADRYDPRVLQRLMAGKSVTASHYIWMCQERERLGKLIARRLAPYDAFIAPTVPILAPAIADVEASDEAFFAANRLAMQNTSLVNLTGGCAISLPCHEPGQLPVGFMLAACQGADHALLNVALDMEPLISLSND